MSDFIKNFWESQAIKHEAAPSASWGDEFAIDLEVNTISKFINKGDIVLDMGCANGFAAYRQFENKNPNKIYGVDYAENMIKFANQIKQNHPQKENFDFSQGDVRKIDFEDEKFDVVYTTRVLINLPTWEEQKRGIEECIRVTKKGGTIIFCEAFYEPLVTINSIRRLTNLPELYEHDFNRYIKKSRLENFLKEKDILFECDEFSSLYYLGSRFVRDLVPDKENYIDYTNPINKMFFEIEKNISVDGLSVQQAYIIKK
jgi:SAM-dependent methyltransferase